MAEDSKPGPVVDKQSTPRPNYNPNDMPVFTQRGVGYPSTPPLPAPPSSVAFPNKTDPLFSYFKKQYFDIGLVTVVNVTTLTYSTFTFKGNCLAVMAGPTVSAGAVTSNGISALLPDCLTLKLNSDFVGQGSGTETNDPLEIPISNVNGALLNTTVYQYAGVKNPLLLMTGFDFEKIVIRQAMQGVKTNFSALTLRLVTWYDPTAPMDIA